MDVRLIESILFAAGAAIILTAEVRNSDMSSHYELQMLKNCCNNELSQRIVSIIDIGLWSVR
jgi:hypothetical protein